MTQNIQLQQLTAISIELITTEDKLEEVDISYLNNSGASSNPNAVRIYPPNLLYNCHSYAWYQTSTSNKYWINDVDLYVKDSHKIVHSKFSAKVGDIVVYHRKDGTRTHSAKIVSITPTGEIMCESKWGVSGIYHHEIGDVPRSYYEGYNDAQYIIYKVYTSHSYSLTAIDDKSHTRVCNFCSYTITSPHSYSVSSYNAHTHTLQCTICKRTVTESHEMLPYHDDCLTCGYINYDNSFSAPIVPEPSLSE